MTRVQVDLRSGSRYLTCWVEPRCKVGDQITLKNHPDFGLRWDVLRVSQPVAATSINQGWENDI